MWQLEIPHFENKLLRCYLHWNLSFSRAASLTFYGFFLRYIALFRRFWSEIGISRYLVISLSRYLVISLSRCHVVTSNVHSKIPTPLPRL